MSDNLQKENQVSLPNSPQKSFTVVDFAHAFGLRYASRLYCVANCTVACMIPSLAGMNFFQNIWYYFMFIYPSVTYVSDIGAYYVSKEKKAKESLSQIAGRVFVSSLFATSIFVIGATVTGQMQFLNCSFWDRLVANFSPNWLSSIFEKISTFAVAEISETSRQFIKFNFYSGFSYMICFVSLGYYFRAIPRFIRDRFNRLCDSARNIAAQREKAN